MSRRLLRMIAFFLGGLRVFTFWFDRESIIPGTFGFAISVCRSRERGHVSKSVYVRVFNDLESLCSSLCDRMTALISRRDE